MKINDKIFITTVKRPGVIKEFLPSGKIKVRYFDKNDKPQMIEVSIQEIEFIAPKNKQYNMVKDVHKEFGSPYADSPQILSGAGEEVNQYYSKALEQISKEMKGTSANGSGGQVLARSSWILEELAEFLAAETLEDQADALTDLSYFDYGTFVELGVEPDNLFDIVNNANLGKLWSDGKPRFNEQKKWVKPPNWEKDYAPEPKLKAEIKRQIKASQRRKVQ